MLTDVVLSLRVSWPCKPQDVQAIKPSGSSSRWQLWRNSRYEPEGVVEGCLIRRANAHSCVGLQVQIHIHSGSARTIAQSCVSIMCGSACMGDAVESPELGENVPLQILR